MFFLDLASAFGFLCAFAFMAVAVFLGGCSVAAFIDLPSILVTIGGSIAVVTLMFPLRTMAIGLPRAIKKVFHNQIPDLQSRIQQVVRLSEIARQDGLLALENLSERIGDPFLREGVMMTVDGASPELVETVLRTRMDAFAAREREAKNVMDQLGKMAPAFGMIGTLLGLIMMLGNLNSPDSIGPAMAVAMITTLYGALLANLICIPFAEKLNFLLKQELLVMELTMRGVLSLHAGDSPRVIQQKLSGFVSVRRAA